MSRFAWISSPKTRLYSTVLNIWETSVVSWKTSVNILLARLIIQSDANTDVLTPWTLWAATFDLRLSDLSIISSYNKEALWAISIQAERQATLSYIFRKSFWSLHKARARRKSIADLKFLPFNSRLYFAAFSRSLYSVYRMFLIANSFVFAKSSFTREKGSSQDPAFSARVEIYF